MSVMIAGFISGTGGLPGMMLWMLLQGCALGLLLPSVQPSLLNMPEHVKGEVLALSESMNNLSILFYYRWPRHSRIVRYYYPQLPRYCFALRR